LKDRMMRSKRSDATIVPSQQRTAGHGSLANHAASTFANWRTKGAIAMSASAIHSPHK
jgi:hypothetical protein